MVIKLVMSIPSNLNFLIVANFFSTRETLAYNLRKIGFTSGEIYRCSDLIQAKQLILDKANTDKPVNFIFSDGQVNDIEISGFLGHIRNSKDCSKIPLIVLLTNLDKDYLKRLVSIGLSEFLQKPWALPNLLSKIQIAWEKHSRDTSVGVSP